MEEIVQGKEYDLTGRNWKKRILLAQNQLGLFDDLICKHGSHWISKTKDITVWVTLKWTMNHWIFGRAKCEKTWGLKPEEDRTNVG